MRLDFAIKNAADFHEGQLDKNGDPYILHPLRVMLHASLNTDQERIVAVLHDAVEDADVSLAWVGAQFGDEIADAVDAISQRKDEQRGDYYKRVKANPLALKVKFADIADNSDPLRLARLDEATQQRLAVKYRDAIIALGYHSTPPPRTYAQGQITGNTFEPAAPIGVHTGAYEQGAEEKIKTVCEWVKGRFSEQFIPARVINAAEELSDTFRALPTQPEGEGR